MKNFKLKTPWTETAGRQETLGEYPRPEMVRDNWVSLNGYWDYAFTRTDRKPDIFAGKILVPFSPESPLSGVGRQLMPGEFLWYQKKVRLPRKKEKYHYLLHFEAVDQTCIVWINGKQVIKHTGGYLPFTIDLKNLCWDSLTITLRVQDDTDRSYHSRGKQKLKRGGMYYTAQSGIWQSVWLEAVPDYYLKAVQAGADPETEMVTLRLFLSDVFTGEEKVSVRVRPELPEDALYRDHPENKELKVGRQVPESAWIRPEEYSLMYYPDSKEARVRFALYDPELWSPEHPFLYHLDLTVGRDHVETYFAMRFLSREEDASGILRFFLNGEPVIMTGVLDQGYWPDGLMTAPSDDALIYDIQTMKDLGFNMLRKHIKIESRRWYYHCDRLGMMVWQDMVSGGAAPQSWFVTYLATLMNAYHISFPDGFGTRWILSRISRSGRREFKREMMQTVNLLYNHPSIVTWTVFNEGWGQFDSAKLSALLWELDDSRNIESASGWFDEKSGDILSYHHYFFKFRYKTEADRVAALTEYGGYTYQVSGHTWSETAVYGYGNCLTQKELNEKYKEHHRNIIYPAMKQAISAAIYTQLSDIEDETNGILTYDRAAIKPDPDLVRKINHILQHKTLP